MSTQKILILFGGHSPEYPISLQSAYSVIQAFQTLPLKEKYTLFLMGITRAGDWYLYEGTTDKIKDDLWHQKDCYPSGISLNRSIHGIVTNRGGQLIEQYIDLVFPILHGRNGEDGTVQGLCQLAGIPVVGCKMLSSAIAMDKDLAHRLAEDAGVRVPRAVTLHGNRECPFPKRADRETGIEAIRKLPLPVFVKPVRAGSSFGITRVTDWEQLEEAIEIAFEHDNQVIVEEGIEGFEVGCAVMGNENLTIGRVDEIELSDGFFDFTEKYTLKTSGIHMPARITAEEERSIRKCAGKIYRALKCQGYARVDMFYTPQKEIVFNEVNTIPGFTSHSRYPNMMKGIGLEFPQLLEALLLFCEND